MLELLAFAFGIAAVGLLMPDVLNFAAPEGGGMNESLSGELGRVVPAAPGAKHNLWVKVRGELWRARTEDPGIAIGTEVRIVRTDGLVAVVEQAPRAPIVPFKPPRRHPAGMTSPRWGLVCWAISCLICWITMGNPLYAILGVPGAIAFTIVSLAGLGDG